jgi:hypothetical protein
MYKAFVPALLVGWIALLIPLAHAQPGRGYVPCLDTVAVNSMSVFVVEVEDLCTPASCTLDNNVVVKVQENLKGDEGSRFQFRIDASPAALTDWRSRRSRLLIFHRLGKDPSWTGAEKVMDLSARDLKVLTADMSLLNVPEQIVRAAREQSIAIQMFTQWSRSPEASPRK